MALKSKYEFEIFNLGNGHPVHLLKFVEIIERSLGIEAEKILFPLQKGDVTETWANTDKAKKLLYYSSKVGVEEGVSKFIENSFD